MQVRALARLSWFFLTGTTAQLVAIGIVIYELLRNPDPEAKTELVRVSGHYERQFVAIFNMVFAYGGQFVFTGGCHVVECGAARCSVVSCCAVQLLG